MITNLIHCNHCLKPTCRLCHLYATDPRYRKLWGANGQTTAPVALAEKPRINISDLAAKRKRCGEAKAAGKPCTEFTTPAPVPQATEIPDVRRSKSLSWATGVTTVPARRDNLLPRTLASLAAGGFDKPRLFIDGESNASEYVNRWGNEVTFRYPNIKTYGNWILGLAELFIRQPHADRYAIFQDDFVTYRNLRQYLESVPYKPKTYLNLYTFPQNAELAKEKIGWFESNQRGKGAVALVFDRESVVALLSHQDIIERPLHADRGWRNVDGGVVTALKKQGWKELTHFPSLTQHTGHATTMRGFDPRHARQPEADTFRGEQFDAMELLSGMVPQPDRLGVSAYDKFEEPLRALLVSEWQAEMKAIERAIAGDIVRQAQARTSSERDRLAMVIDNYRQRLRQTENNNPPYFTQERRHEIGRSGAASPV